MARMAGEGLPELAARTRLLSFYVVTSVTVRPSPRCRALSLNVAACSVRQPTRPAASATYRPHKKVWGSVAQK